MSVPMKRSFMDDGKLVQTRYWIDIGGWGMNPDMLVLTGFWPESVMSRLETSNVDTSQAIEQIYGGVLRFKPLPGKEWERRLDRVIDGLNKILQAKRHIQDVAKRIPGLLKEEWHVNENSFLPEDLSEDLKNLIVRDRTYIIASDHNTTSQILSLLPILNGLKNNGIGYYPGIYREANTLFGRMVLETVNMSLENLAIKDGSQPQYVELEKVADMAARNIQES